MKLNKEEFKQLLNEKIIDNDLLIELLEDVEDSIEEEDLTELKELKIKYDELLKKYKERFLNGDKKEEKEEKEELEELEEKEVIDIKEI